MCFASQIGIIPAAVAKNPNKYARMGAFGLAASSPKAIKKTLKVASPIAYNNPDKALRVASPTLNKETRRNVLGSVGINTNNYGSYN
jgi:hypothetical protein